MKFLLPVLLLLSCSILNGAVGDVILQTISGTNATTETTVTKTTSHLIGWNGSGTLTAIPTPTGTITSFAATDSTGIDFTVTNPTSSPTLSLALTKAAVGLSNVENTALSTWAGSTNISQVGTITTGNWLSTVSTPNAGLSIQDAGGEALTFNIGEDLTAARQLTLLLGDADRSLTISGNADISGTNTGDLTLAGSPNYLTLSNQVLTRSLINLSSHVTGTLPVVNGGTGLTSTGTAGNVLTATSSGTWVSATPSASGITALTGDVTASGSGSVAATIANDAVTFAKMANLSASRLIGRTSASSGDPQAITMGQGVTMNVTALEADIDDRHVAYVRTGATGTGVLGEVSKPFASIDLAFAATNTDYSIIDVDENSHILEMSVADVATTRVLYIRGAGPNTNVTILVTGAASGDSAEPGEQCIFGIDNDNPFVIVSDHSCNISFDVTGGAGADASPGSDANGSDGGAVGGYLVIKNAIVNTNTFTGGVGGAGDGAGNAGAQGVSSFGLFEVINCTVTDPGSKITQPRDSLVDNAMELPTSAITSGTFSVSRGGTGLSSITANRVLLGNGTSALQTVAPSTSGNVLTSNGTTWTSAVPAAVGYKMAYYTSTASGTTTVSTAFSTSQKPMTEGTEFMEITYTPRSATNRLKVHVRFLGGSSSAGFGIMLLARSGDANSRMWGISDSGNTTSRTDTVYPSTLVLDEVAGGTSAITYKVRYGGTSAGTFWMNRANAGAYPPGTASFIEITEYTP